MRRAIAIGLLALSVVEGAGCSSAPQDEPRGYTTGAYRANEMKPEAMPAASAGSPSAAKDAKDLEPWNGQEVSLRGIFESDRAIHGVVRLPSGLRVWLVHFDHIRRGDDWLAYVGKPCEAYGILHTYTRDIDGYRHPRLEVKEFSGTRE